MNPTWHRNIATGKLFISLRFFRKGTPNYVYIDLKRSPSNLTLGQCKFDLRSMSKTSKLCQVVYHSTRLDGTKVFKLLCGYSGSKDNYHKPKRVPYEKDICNIWREIARNGKNQQSRTMSAWLCSPTVFSSEAASVVSVQCLPT